MYHLWWLPLIVEGEQIKSTLSFRRTDNSTSRIVKNILNWFFSHCLGDIRQASSALCRLQENENNRNSFKFRMHPCLCNQLVVVLCRIVQCGLILLTKFTECRGGKTELCFGVWISSVCWKEGNRCRLFVHRRKTKKKKKLKTTDYLLRAERGHSFALSDISTFSYWRSKCLGKTTWCSKLALPIRKKINLSMLSSQDGTLINAMPKSLGTKLKLIP